MKYVAALCLLAVALGAPQRDFRREPWRIIRNDITGPDASGYFRHDLETENGIQETREGTPGSEGQTNMSGTFRFPLPDGTFAVVNWVADELGFRAESPLIPVGPPIPPHAQRQIEFAERQRALGNTVDQGGRRRNRF